MIRTIIFLFNMVGVLSINLLLSEDVSLSVGVPSEVNAGAEFDVELNLKKGSIESFARFQQDLPNGLTAQVVDPSNANFTFENQKIKIIWLKLPSEKDIKVLYRLRVDERLKGQFDLKGFFSYIEGNERKSINITSSTINIKPSLRIDPNLIVDIQEFQQMVPVQPPVSLVAKNVRCIRQVPSLIGTANEYTVNILVNKGSTEKFAKIEEDIPQGFKAEPVHTKDAIFTFKNQKVKFLWMNLPAEQRFVVSYKLIPINKDEGKQLTLKGTFSFIVNEATQVIDIVQKEVDLSNLDPKNIEGIIASVPNPTFSSTVSQGGVASKSYTEPSVDGGKEIEIKYQKIEGKKQVTSKRVFDLKPYMLEPEKGVYYRVQIAAGHKPVNIKQYFKRYKIPQEVRTEEHEGWYKYSVGSFPAYKEARDYRVNLWKTTTINDAFVAAYNNGTRITVQEALMITNQKWCR
ncbi:MAG: SPOR domain-containing protein [Bacteroidales bacterium]|nr:SPOR domain-containing protein [Bacteroidales bacterium]